MARYSLHLGVNAPAESHYGEGVVPPLRWAHQDARDWRSFFTSRGWQTTCWVGESATTSNLAHWIDGVVAKGDADLVVITWSGHGAQIPNETRLSAGRPDQETDDFDELWAMHDRFLFDDEVLTLMSQFKPPTRVVVIADSCHSGTSFRFEPTEEDGEVQAGKRTPRMLEDGIVHQVVARNAVLYASVVRSLESTTSPTIAFVGLAACRDDERAYEADGQGVFTRALLDLLRAGFDKSYHDLLKAAAHSTPYQHPRAFWYDDATLLHERAFG